MKNSSSPKNAMSGIICVVLTVMVIVIILPVVLDPEYHCTPQLDHCKDTDLLCCVAAYNCDIDRVYRRVERLGQDFRSWTLYLYASDSTLDTVHQQIEDLRYSQDNIVIVKPVQLSHAEKHDIDYRTVRIGRIREELLNTVKEMEDTSDDSKVVLMYDGDHENEISNLDNFKTAVSLIRDRKFDVLCSYGFKNHKSSINIIYDCYAMRKKNTHFPPGRIEVYKLMFELRYVRPHIEVDSAFGGAALYRLNDLVHCHYISPPNTCEHVILHEHLRRKGLKIHITRLLCIDVGNQPSIMIQSTK